MAGCGHRVLGKQRVKRQTPQLNPSILAMMFAGVEQIFGLGELSAYEAEGLKALMPELRQSIQKGACCLWMRRLHRMLPVQVSLPAHVVHLSFVSLSVRSAGEDFALEKQ